MSRSKSKSRSSNTTSTVDKRTTDTINAGVGGDIEDSTVFSGIDGHVFSSTSTSNDFSDYELDNSVEIDYEDDNSVEIDYEDDNSVEIDYEDDNSVEIDYEDDNSVEIDYENEIDNSNTRTSWDDYDSSIDNSRTSWDDFDNSVSGSNVYRNVEGGVHITDGRAFELAEKVVSTLSSSQEKTMASANELVAQSVSTLGKIKEGGTTAEPANKNLEAVAKLGGVAVVAFAAVKVAGKFGK